MEAAHPRVKRRPARAYSVTREPGGRAAGTPCHVAARPAEACHCCSTEDPSSRSAPTLRGCRPGAPSAEGSPRLPPTCSVGFFPGAATATSAWPRGHSFQHAFTHTRCALGPGPHGYSPYAPGPREAHRLLQSKRSVSTPGSGPNSDTHTAASHCWSEGEARESCAHRVVTGQGPHAFRCALAPTAATARLDGFTPTCLTRAPFVANSCRTRGGNSARDAHAVTRALSNESAWHTTRKAQRAMRVAAHAPSRKKRTHERTQGTFHPRAHRLR